MQQVKLHPIKQIVKQNNTATAPNPGFITQVNKEDERKFQLLDFFNVSRCCSALFKCFPSTKTQVVAHEPVLTPNYLLDPQLPKFKGKKTLVLDLDETLVHSTFEKVANPDLVLPVQIQNVTYHINVIIRPGTEEFLARVGALYEVVVFTASLAEYAEPLVKILDTRNVVSSLLFRQHCTPLNGIYVKDMSILGRDAKDIILVDNSPNSFLFQPENAFHIKNFFDDKSDRELDSLLYFLEEIAFVEDVRPIEQHRARLAQQPNQAQRSKSLVNDKQSPSSDVELSSIRIQEQQTMASPTGKEEGPRGTNKELAVERERSSNCETEPDLKKLEREEEIVSVAKSDRFEKKFTPFFNKTSPHTDRVANDWLLGYRLDSSVDLELPSPKESDVLINHRENNIFTTENNSNETEAEKKRSANRPKVPSLATSGAAVFNKVANKPAARILTIENKTIEGHKLEEVRMSTGISNLNSPLGRQIKIEFGQSQNVVSAQN